MSKDPSVGRAKTIAVVNLLLTILFIAFNGLANARIWFDTTVGELSDRYDTSFTPAGYAFSIWGLIFVAQLVLCGFHLKRAFVDGPSDPARIETILSGGVLFGAAQIVCGSWLVAWLSEAILVSLLLMVVLFALLFGIIVRWNMEREDPPWSVIAGEWWPISLYAGWISVALLANVGTYLASLGVEFVRAPGFAIAFAGLLVTFHLVMIFWRNMREFSMVAVWALLGVAVRHAESIAYGLVSQVAVGGALVLLFAAVYHAKKNFTLPPPR